MLQAAKGAVHVVSAAGGEACGEGAVWPMSRGMIGAAGAICAASATGGHCGHYMHIIRGPESAKGDERMSRACACHACMCAAATWLKDGHLSGVARKSLAVFGVAKAYKGKRETNAHKQPH